MAADALPGSTPNSLALTPDGAFLFVANAGNKASVAVFDVATPGKSRSLGFIPVGWHADLVVRVTPDGKNLLVANGKGQLSHANRNGPQPAPAAGLQRREYIGKPVYGTLSVIPLPKKGEEFEAKMREFTALAFKCSPLRPRRHRVLKPGGSIPSRPAVGGEPDPLRIYVVKENRTLRPGARVTCPGQRRSDALCLFDESVTPNHHALAREFVLLDNFYVDSEVSADGHEWSVGGLRDRLRGETWPL
jgi:hypothetical protein